MRAESPGDLFNLQSLIVNIWSGSQESAFLTSYEVLMIYSWSRDHILSGRSLGWVFGGTCYYWLFQLTLVTSKICKIFFVYIGTKLLHALLFTCFANPWYRILRLYCYILLDSAHQTGLKRSLWILDLRLMHSESPPPFTNPCSWYHLLSIILHVIKKTQKNPKSGSKLKLISWIGIFQVMRVWAVNSLPN